MRRGPKDPVVEGPLDLSMLPKTGGERVIAFVSTFLHVPKGEGARKPFVLRPWQEDIVRELFDDPRPRTGLLSIPRGNGKSTLAAAVGLFGLLADRVEGAQVLCVASDERQAKIIFNAARRMVELNPLLAERCQIFQSKIYVPSTDSTLYTMPAEPGALQGFDPSLALVDELHVVTEDVWGSVQSAVGKRDTSLTWAISTPSASQESVMFKLREHGLSGIDDAFWFREYAAPAGCDLDDEHAWAEANPALDDFLFRDAFPATLRTLRESEFRRYRLGQWVEQVEGAWLPDGAWAACEDARTIPDGASVVLGFDGSYNGDCTAIVAVTIAEKPHVEVVELWESPPGESDWTVPIAAVEQVLRDACVRWRVTEIVADPYRWAKSLQSLRGEGLPTLEYPQSPQRMVPATARLYEAVTNNAVTHSGDPRLARHVAAAVAKVDSRGVRVVKEHRKSSRRIDLTVATIMAFDRAAQTDEAKYDLMQSIW